MLESFIAIATTMLLSDAVNIPVLAAGGIVNAKMAKAAQLVGAEGAFVGTCFILSKECRVADFIKNNILETHPDDYIIFSQKRGQFKWRTTQHKVGIEDLEANKNGNMNPSPGNFYYGMFKGDLDASVTTICNAASLIHSIDSCEDIVKDLAARFVD